MGIIPLALRYSNQWKHHGVDNPWTVDKQNHSLLDGKPHGKLSQECGPSFPLGRAGIKASTVSRVQRVGKAQGLRVSGPGWLAYGNGGSACFSGWVTCIMWLHVLRAQEMALHWVPFGDIRAVALPNPSCSQRGPDKERNPASTGKGADKAELQKLP